jgi:hypothetical protein
MVTQADSLMKGYYASEFLYISAVSLPKLSILILFYNIVAVQRWYRRFVIGFGTFIVAWCISSLAAVAIQCKLPRPWEMLTLRCFNTVSDTYADAVEHNANGQSELSGSSTVSSTYPPKSSLSLSR